MKLKRGQNRFEQSKYGVATKTIPDMCNKGINIITEGRQYEVIGIYHYDNEVEDNYMIKTLHSYSLVHLDDIELVENKV